MLRVGWHWPRRQESVQEVILIVLLLIKPCLTLVLGNYLFCILIIKKQQLHPIWPNLQLQVFSQRQKGE